MSLPINYSLAVLGLNSAIKNSITLMYWAERRHVKPLLLPLRVSVCMNIARPHHKFSRNKDNQTFLKWTVQMWITLCEGPCPSSGGFAAYALTNLLRLENGRLPERFPASIGIISHRYNQ